MNVASGSRRPTPPETLDLIREQNRYDVELYRWANERMDRLISQDPGFATAHERFLRLNRLYRAWGHLSYTLPKKIHDRVVAPG